MSRTIAWFSSGAASAVMTRLMLSEDPSIIVVQCDLGTSEDEDNRRFTADCVRWFNAPVVTIGSTTFASIDEVFEKRKYLSGFNGAPCTGEMKVVPRLDFQLPSDTHLWGYTADANDVERFDRMVATYPEMTQRAPLIERGITKEACHAILERAGIKRPRIYDMGFPNGNCIGCVKASSPGYWALVRRQFPEVFARRADQCRRFGVKLAIVGREKDENGKIRNVRAFIDDIPADQPVANATVPSCDFLCHMAEQDIKDTA